MPRKPTQTTQSDSELLAGVTQAFQGSTRILSARPDPIDFRDRMFEPTLVEVPPRIPLEQYLGYGIPILDQRAEGACTGFALASVANFLLRRRAIDPDHEPVSPRMLYEMARRFDEFPGEEYVGSTARGAMKGWHKNGVCSEQIWPYQPARPGQLTEARIIDAARRPLGAYYRVNHKELVAMHSAIAEVGILYATAQVHSGWQQVGAEGVIHYAPGSPLLGGHAFVLVAYDQYGFWIQNSWGTVWGKAGFAHLAYADWLDNGTDVWVARLGAPIFLDQRQVIAPQQYTTARLTAAVPLQELRPHVILLDNDGRLQTNGSYGVTAEELRLLVSETIPRLTANWNKKRILLYAHGGLVSEQAAIQWVTQERQRFLAAEIYPLSFVWRSDALNTLGNILQDAFDRRSSGTVFDLTKNFMLDRLDDALEPLARILGGKTLWDEMKENALLASTSATGGARQLIQALHILMSIDPAMDLHLVGHSAGAIFLAPLIQLIATNGLVTQGPLKGKKGLGRSISSCSLWAPACTLTLFQESYLPIIQQGGIGRFTLYTLTDEDEQADSCANLYHKSILYLISNAFEKKPRIPLIREDGETLLGMAKFVQKNSSLQALIQAGQVEWIQPPNPQSSARTHTSFNDDGRTLQSTIERIRGD